MIPDTLMVSQKDLHVLLQLRAIKTNIYLKCNGLNSLGLFTIQGWELDVKQSLMSIRTSESIQISTHHNSLSSKVKIQTKTITKFNLHAIYYKTHSQLNMRTTINHWNQPYTILRYVVNYVWHCSLCILSITLQNSTK